MKAEYTKPEFSEFFFFSHITLSFFQLLPFIKVLRRQQKKTEQITSDTTNAITIKGRKSCLFIRDA